MEAGYKKDIIKAGDGKTFPKKGDQVSVHYTGKLTNGKVFDSSIPKKRYFKFFVGMGNVIRAWDEGVATMSKGEKCILTASPEYAYGEDGIEGVIPPNATLIFEVELFEIETAAPAKKKK
jgi:FKBP-type peptidyl-prolyl cis-trans isomerase